jgi:hypothetical protein
MTGTPSRTARVSGVTQNLKEAAGKLPVRGTPTYAHGKLRPGGAIAGGG